VVCRGSLGDVVTRSGLILDDRYRLDQRIAAGGVGQVWQATDLLLERPVAVKVLRPEYADHPETLERFRKEARNAGALSNSHVAQVYDYGPSGPNGSPYLVMEFVDGPSLADLLVVDPIEPARALDVIAQAADGLAAAHKAGVIHRDIKPGNILISSEGQVKVTDFGIAHAAGQAPVTGPGLVMGTTQYMAPERIAGSPGTAASDLYALGIVLHECLTGVPPHDGTAADVMAAHLYLPLPPLPADVPAELDVLVDRLTTKDPTRRISDARELADLAARLRDSMTGGMLIPPIPSGRGPVPSAHGAVQSGPGAAVPGPVSQAAARAAAAAPGWADGSGQASEDSTGNTALLAASDGYAGRSYVSDEWNVPPRMSRPTGPPAPGSRRGTRGGGPAPRSRSAWPPWRAPASSRCWSPARSPARRPRTRRLPGPRRQAPRRPAGSRHTVRQGRPAPPARAPRRHKPRPARRPPRAGRSRQRARQPTRAPARPPAPRRAAARRARPPAAARAGRRPARRRPARRPAPRPRPRRSASSASSV